MKIPKARVWWGVIWPLLKFLLWPVGVTLAVVVIVGLLFGGPALIEWHTAYRTASIPVVKRGIDLEYKIEGTVKGGLLYMNDGTVWEIMAMNRQPNSPELGLPYDLNGFLAGDAVRYENPAADPVNAPQDDLDYCLLYDETTGWEGLGKRLTAPFAHSSCPAHTSTGSLFWGLFKRDSWW